MTWKWVVWQTGQISLTEFKLCTNLHLKVASKGLQTCKPQLFQVKCFRRSFCWSSIDSKSWHAKIIDRKKNAQGLLSPPGIWWSLYHRRLGAGGFCTVWAPCSTSGTPDPVSVSGSLNSGSADHQNQNPRQRDTSWNPLNLWTAYIQAHRVTYTIEESSFW